MSTFGGARLPGPSGCGGRGGPHTGGRPADRARLFSWVQGCSISPGGFDGGLPDFLLVVRGSDPYLASLGSHDGLVSHPCLWCAHPPRCIAAFSGIPLVGGSLPRLRACTRHPATSRERPVRE